LQVKLKLPSPKTSSRDQLALPRKSQKRWQITIPYQLRKALGWAEGTLLEFTSKEGGIYIKVDEEKEIKTALQEVQEGKTRPISELIAELGLKKDVTLSKPS
jgi:AbrB family looped-hinge helix DNA binding protein